jgi:nucleotide-binding universal stress UspA family protein
MFKKILIAKDGSNQAFRALDVVTNRARKYDVGSLILHICAYYKMPLVFWRMLKIGSTGNTMQVNVAESIPNRIAIDGPDSVAPGTRGIGPADRLLTGSVAASATQLPAGLRLTVN